MAYRIQAARSGASASQKPYHEPTLSGLKTTGTARVTAQAASYVPIVNALGKAEREKQRPTLAAKTSSPHP